MTTSPIEIELQEILKLAMLGPLTKAEHDELLTRAQTALAALSHPVPDVPEEVEAIRARHEEVSRDLPSGWERPVYYDNHAGKDAHTDRATLLALANRLTVERNVLRRELAAHNEGRLGAMRLLDAARGDLREVREAGRELLASIDGYDTMDEICYASRLLAAALKEKP